jgi:hypothetical protein
MADQSKSDDRFGWCVAIYGDFMLAGSPKIPLHIYKFNEGWELFKTVGISAISISHSENNFMVSSDYQLESFILNSDGSFSENSISSDFDVGTISWYGEITELRDSLAIVDVLSPKCYLFKYKNGNWIIEKTYSPDPGEYCQFMGMSITDKEAIIGGVNAEDTRYSYVYFRSF